MFRKIARVFISTIIVVGGLGFSLLAPVSVHAETADITNNMCNGIALSGNTTDSSVSGCQSGVNQDATLNNVMGVVINTFSVVIGFIAVVMIIYGGFRYITSGGDSGKVTAAKNTILYALVGIVIVALAQILVRFVYAKAANTVAV